ncbi:MAG TPA: fasciclin domain-containing protein [Bryobacteraceae bacterium]|jgi:uncharacterized surface protein with fasciclin (FAS1) repeats|nr:fasciclin domain-containing protein [Bryobacteraceae bacterium]
MASQEGISHDQTVDPGIDSRLATSNILDTLRRLPECSDFLKLVNRADLAYLLRYPELQTLFAPVNGSIPEGLRTDAIEKLVMGQMLRRAVESYDLKLLPAVETNAGERVAVQQSNDSITLGGAHILRANIPCTNGVIHVVDSLLQSEKGEISMPSPASPGTNQFRCNACGRYFNTASELRQHETECRAAKVATAEGTRELRAQDSEPHQPNDAESKEARFQHGTRPAQEASRTDARASSEEGPGQEEIAARAYQCWHERGCPHGSPEVDWHRAVEELRSQTARGSQPGPQARVASAGRG